MRSKVTRRQLLLTTAGVSAAAMARESIAGQDDQPLIIDCHAHIYGEDETKYPTIEKPYRPPKGKGTIAHLRREMAAAGVRYVTAIQTSTYYRWDNRFTSDSSRKHRDFMVGVVTLNPDDPQSPQKLERYVREYNVRGMRSIPGQSGRLDAPGVARLWATAERLGVVINVLTDRSKRAEIESLSQRHPKLRFVIDHCLNIRADADLEATVAAMESLARLPLAHAKLTFIPTGTKKGYPCDKSLHEACRAVIRAFSPQRCVWGSDFPCELWCPNVSYQDHLRIFTEALELDAAAKQAILGATAHRLWIRPRA